MDRRGRRPVRTDFLSSLIGLLKGDPDIALGFTESNAIDEASRTSARVASLLRSMEPGALASTEVFAGRTSSRAISGQEHHPQCHRCYGVGRRCWSAEDLPQRSEKPAQGRKHKACPDLPGLTIGKMRFRSRGEWAGRVGPMNPDARLVFHRSGE